MTLKNVEQEGKRGRNEFKKKEKPFTHVRIMCQVFFSRIVDFMDFLDRWHVVVALIAFPIVLLHLNEFDPCELFCLNDVVMQEPF